jgi:hypothetical protein
MTTRVLQVVKETSGYARTFPWKICVSGRFLDLFYTVSPDAHPLSQRSGRCRNFGLMLQGSSALLGNKRA